MTNRTLAGVLAVALTAAACAPRSQSSALLALPQDSRMAGRQGDVAAAPEVWRRLARQLPPGAVVRLALTDGRRLRANLMAVERDVLVVRPRTRIPEPLQRIPYAAIESLEPDANRGIGPGKAVAIGIGTGAATFVALILLTLAIYSD